MKGTKKFISSLPVNSLPDKAPQKEFIVFQHGVITEKQWYFILPHKTEKEARKYANKICRKFKDKIKEVHPLNKYGKRKEYYEGQVQGNFSAK